MRCIYGTQLSRRILAVLPSAQCVLVPTQSTSQASTLNFIDELLISKEISKKMWPANHPHGAAIATIAKRLHGTEAESAVIAYLCYGTSRMAQSP